MHSADADPLAPVQVGFDNTLLHGQTTVNSAGKPKVSVVLCPGNRCCRSPDYNQRKVESGLEVLYGRHWEGFRDRVASVLSKALVWFGLLLAVQVLTSEVNQNAACGAWTGRLKFVFW